MNKGIRTTSNMNYIVYQNKIIKKFNNINNKEVSTSIIEYKKSSIVANTKYALFHYTKAIPSFLQ